MPFVLLRRSFVPPFADTTDLGHQALEFRNLYLGDAGGAYFGLAQDVRLARLAPDVLGLAAGDSFRIPADGQLQFGTGYYLKETATAGISGLALRRISDNLLMSLELGNIYLTHTGALRPNATTGGQNFRVRAYDGDGNDRLLLEFINGSGVGDPARLRIGSAAGTWVLFVDNKFGRAVDNDGMWLYGGSPDGINPYVVLYGKSHPTLPGRVIVATPNSLLTGAYGRIVITGAVDSAIIDFTPDGASSRLKIEDGLVTLGANVTLGTYKLIMADALLRSEGGLYPRLLVRNPADSVDMPLQALAFMTASLKLKEAAPTRLDLRDATDTDWRDLRIRTLEWTYHIYPGVDSGAYVRTTGADGSDLLFGAKDSGGIVEEVMRLQGAVEPHVLLTHARVGARALPTPSTYFRGFVYRVEGGAGVADKLYLCMKNSADGYEWVQMAVAS